MPKFQFLKLNYRLFLPLFSILFSSFFSTFAQQPTAPVATAPLLKRTTYKTEKVDFGAGGTLTLVGAPVGSITIEGWQKNEVEISAETEVQAATEADLAVLAQLDGFIIDDDMGHIRVRSVGTHDKDYLKKAAKKLPKNLLSLPFKIDYHIKVPMYCDLEINGGRGDFSLANIQGSMKINFLESNAKINLIGGDVDATFGAGSVEMNIPIRSWRGRGLDVQVASGDLNVYLQPNFSADIKASILRTGKIENSIESLKPRDRTTFTDKLMTARNGAGGANLSFTVGDGTVKMTTETLKSQN